MKIDGTPNDKDQVKLVAERHQEKQSKFIGSTIPKRGHKLYTLEIATGKITITKMLARLVVQNSGKRVVKKSVDVQEGCFYISALNEKNARKKLIKLGILKS